MLKGFTRLIICRNTFRKFNYRTYKVAVLGASGGVGQPLCLFFKKTPLINNLALYDIKNVKGVAVDLSHIERKGKVTAYEGKEELDACLFKSDIVIIPAGAPRNPGMDKNDFFNANAKIVADLSVSIAKSCPNAIICLITNPINSTVPIVGEILKHFNVFDPNKLFGITTLSAISAISIVAKAKNIDITKLNVPVLGGHSEHTMIPILSQSAPPVQFPLAERNAIVDEIRNASTSIVDAKEGHVSKFDLIKFHGSSTLSMAWAAYRFTNSLIEARGGREGVIEAAYVKSDETECEYFSTPLILGADGIERNLGIGKMTEYEVSMLKAAIPEIKKDIETGKKFAASYLSSMK